MSAIFVVKFPISGFFFIFMMGRIVERGALVPRYSSMVSYSFPELSYISIWALGECDTLPLFSILKWNLIIPCRSVLI